MRKVVYKYPIALGGRESLGAHPGRVVAVGVQGENPCVWVEHDLDRAGSLEIEVRVTGMPFDSPGGGDHVGTFMLDSGTFVGHVYQITGN